MSILTDLNKTHLIFLYLQQTFPSPNAASKFFCFLFSFSLSFFFCFLFRHAEPNQTKPNPPKNKPNYSSSSSQHTHTIIPNKHTTKQIEPPTLDLRFLALLVLPGLLAFIFMLWTRWRKSRTCRCWRCVSALPHHCGFVTGGGGGERPSVGDIGTVHCCSRCGDCRFVIRGRHMSRNQRVLCLVVPVVLGLILAVSLGVALRRRTV